MSFDHTMTARRAVRFAVLAVVALMIARAVGGPEGSPLGPNILLVSIDSLRSDHLGCYGYARPTSPTIDWLAREGVLFRRAISSSSWTLPSHVTLFTAKPTDLHGVVEGVDRLVPAAVTLAEVLRDHGYETFAAVSGPYLRALYGLDQGFDVYDESTAATGVIESFRGTTSPRLISLVNGFVAQWRRRAASRPFFVFVHMWDVHYDYAPPPPFSTMFDPDYRGSVTGERFILDPAINASMDPRDLEHLIALYDGEIRYTDGHLGSLLRELARSRVLDDTIVAVLSDHGDEFFEHGAKGHGEALFDETIQIPLVIRYPPRIPAGQIVEEQVRMMDVAPTMLGLAGIPAPAGFGTGSDIRFRETDLSPWITRPPAADPFPLLLAFSATQMGGDSLRSVRAREGKFIRRTELKRPARAYDLVADPRETTNLATRSGLPQFAAQLRAEDLAWQAAWAPRDRFAEPVQLDAEHVARLRALGYME